MFSTRIAANDCFLLFSFVSPIQATPKFHVDGIYADFDSLNPIRIA
jgi:hypothetical protein